MDTSLDLGPMDGPVLVFGGPYGNLQAMRAEARRLGIPAERCLCTGDVVAYCADPRATLDLIRAWGVPVVRGNCEDALAEGAADCGCNFTPGSVCDALSKQWCGFAGRRLGGDARAWMAGLPRSVRFTLAGRRVIAVHSGITDISRYVFASTDDTVKRGEAARAGADLVVGVHSGLPFTQTLADGTVWHNAGAIGMPANDGTPDVWYALLTPAAGGIAVSHHRLAYDHAAAAARMRAEGLAEAYASALETGLRPSLDILPPRERAETGRPLNASRLPRGPNETAARPSAA